MPNSVQMDDAHLLPGCCNMFERLSRMFLAHLSISNVLSQVTPQQGNPSGVFSFKGREILGLGLKECVLPEDPASKAKKTKKTSSTPKATRLRSFALRSAPLPRARGQPRERADRGPEDPAETAPFEGPQGCQKGTKQKHVPCVGGCQLKNKLQGPKEASALHRGRKHWNFLVHSWRKPFAVFACRSPHPLLVQ